MSKPKKDLTKQALQRIADLLELTMCTVSALEKAGLENAGTEQQLTNRQLNRLKRQAKVDIKATFDTLEALIRSLTTSLP
jgi:hypothetical protein